MPMRIILCTRKRQLGSWICTRSPQLSRSSFSWLKGRSTFCLPHQATPPRFHKHSESSPTVVATGALVLPAPHQPATSGATILTTLSITRHGTSKDATNICREYKYRRSSATTSSTPSLTHQQHQQQPQRSTSLTKMPVSKLPFHADHIGSLIRPQSVNEAQDQADAGKITQAQLREVQQKEISAIVKKQQDNNVRALCSGEFDRKYYFSGFFEKLDGFKEVSPVPWELARLSAAPIAALKKAGKQYPMAAICEGKIKYSQSPYLENWKLLRECVPKEQWGECKFTMPPPCYFHLRLGPGKCYSKEAYSNDQEFFDDLAAAYRQEFKTLYGEGLRNIQIDDPTLAYFCSDDMLKGLRDDGEDTDKMFELYLKAHNDCIADRPDDLHVGLHICRGNFSKSMHFSEGSYEAIAEKFFKTLNYDTFYLEYDNPRSGGFEPLRFLPKHKNVVLGVVTTKDPQMEDLEVLKQRVREAAEIIAKGQGRSVEEAMENIGISPQCGFASVAIGAEGMTEEKMFAKLKLVQDVAKQLWPDRP